jgi:hypothetical protein
VATIFIVTPLCKSLYALGHDFNEALLLVTWRHTRDNDLRSA